MAENKAKRCRKPSSKVLTNGLSSKPSQTCTKWCKVLSVQDNKVHLCSSKALETELNDYVTMTDLKIGNNVVWRCKGVPYTVQVQKVFDEKPGPDWNKLEKIHYDEDSSSDEEICPPLKKKKEKEVYIEESESDDDYSSVIARKHTTKRMGDLADIILSGESQKTSNGDFESLHKKITTIEMLLKSVSDKCDLILKSHERSLGVESLQVVSSDSPCHNVKEEVVVEDSPTKYISDNGVRLLSLRGNTPDKYSLSLMDALFGEKVMAKSSFGTIKSSKPSLPQDKMQLLQDCVDKRFGPGSFQTNAQLIQRKCNQKCLDTNKRLKKNGAENTT